MDRVADSDETLMMRYVDGDMTAFERLYQRHKGPVYRYLLRLCRHEAIAEELFQEVWMKLINARTSYVASARFSSYLYKLAHNRFIDHYRKQKLRQVDCGVALADSGLELTDGSDPEQALVVEQTLDEFAQVLEALPREQLEVFVLKEESGLSLHEIADTTGVDYETAKSRLRYAFKKLHAVVNT